MTLRKVMMAALAVAMALPLASCGRRGLPIPPEDATYPRTYPRIEFPDGGVSTPTTPGEEVYR